MRSKRVMAREAMLVLVLSLVLCGTALCRSPMEYYPIGAENSWLMWTTAENAPSFSDRWTYIETTRDTLFGFPGERRSFRVAHSEWSADWPDTNVYRVEYYCYNENFDLCTSAFEEEDGSLILYESLPLYLGNPVAVGDSVYLQHESWEESYVVVSVTDTVQLPIGSFSECLHVRERRSWDGVPRDWRDVWYAPIDYWPVAGGPVKVRGVHWISYPDSFRVTNTHLLEADVFPTGVPETPGGSESGMRLLRPRPNPARSTVVLAVASGERRQAVVRVLDVSGREVARVLDDVVGPGWRQLKWNTEHLPSGVYFVMLESDGDRCMEKVVLLR